MRSAMKPVRQKKLLKSDSIVDYLIGMSYLQIAFYDGGHTYFPSECFTVSIEQPLSSVEKNIKESLNKAPYTEQKTK